MTDRDARELIKRIVELWHTEQQEILYLREVEKRLREENADLCAVIRRLRAARATQEMALMLVVAGVAAAATGVLLNGLGQ